jgi:diguanylate cyclase (GGDEF)-like protein
MVSETKNPIQAVLFVDLDRFKTINDDYGHEIGDAMIKHLARTLVYHVGDHGFVGRIGGDEFMIALQSPRDQALAKKILESLARPSRFHAWTLSTSASIGIAKASNPRQSSDEWIRQADVAVYKAKTDGRSRYVVYDKSLDEAAIEAKRVEAVLRDAIETETLDVHFQPIWNIQNGSLVGFEALARLKDPLGGMISPAIFIPIAEQNRQIHQVGEIIMRRSCAIAATWENPVRISVNISPAQMTAKRRMIDFVSEALQSSGLAPERLEIEITEGILLDQNEDVMKDLSEIQKKGTRIVIDDFGAGYSGISYFWKFPFDKIKLDRSLVQGEEIMFGAKTATLKTIMELARQFSMEVVGEGVETAEDLEFLKTLGCHQAQGYLLGRPMPAEHAANLARRRASTANAAISKRLPSFAA